MVEEEARAILDDLFQVAERRLSEQGVGIGLDYDSTAIEAVLTSPRWPTTFNPVHTLKFLFNRAFADPVMEMLLDRRLIPGQILQVCGDASGALRFRVLGRPDGR